MLAGAHNATMQQSDGITPLEQARRAAERDGRLIDLVSSDFRGAGLSLPESLYLRAWEEWRRAPAYHPDARGAVATRSAIADWMTADGLATSAEQIVVTCGSSISYLMLFRAMTAARRDRTTVALPSPGYPLFESLVRTAGLHPVYYSCRAATGWIPDRASVDDALETSPVALVVISPNNPSGAVYEWSVVHRIVERARASGTPVISDEVFSAFRTGTTELPRPARLAGADDMVATLNGLSKLCAAPEVKLGWIALHGDARLWSPVRDALEIEHDLYLTVSAYAEAAARRFLSDGETARSALAGKVAERMDVLERCIGESRWIRPAGSAPPSVGGIHRIVEIDAARLHSRLGTSDDERCATRLVRLTGVHLHPGYLYQVPEAPDGSPRFVVTGLRQPEATRSAFQRLDAVLDD